MDFRTIDTLNTRLYLKYSGTDEWKGLNVSGWKFDKKLGAVISADISRYTEQDPAGVDIKIEARGMNGNSTEWILNPAFAVGNYIPTGVDDDKRDASLVPDKFVLNCNYPNPFNPATTISYSLPQHAHVELIVFDMLGREIKRLVDKDQTIGIYKVKFDASSLPSGIYIYTLQTDRFGQSRKLLLLK